MAPVPTTQNGDGRHVLDGLGRQARRQLALEYARDVLEAPPEQASVITYRHALLAVVDQLQAADDELARYLVDAAPVMAARRVLEAARRPDRCRGSAKLVAAIDVVDGLAQCGVCGRGIGAERIRGCDRWAIVVDHPPAAVLTFRRWADDDPARPPVRVDRIVLTPPAERRGPIVAPTVASIGPGPEPGSSSPLADAAFTAALVTMAAGVTAYLAVCRAAHRGVAAARRLHRRITRHG